MNIDLHPEEEISVYSSDAGYVVVKVYCEECGHDKFVIMKPSRAKELSHALMKVARHIETNKTSEVDQHEVV